jgi:hypothetical protein
LELCRIDAARHIGCEHEQEIDIGCAGCVRQQGEPDQN